MEKADCLKRKYRESGKKSRRIMRSLPEADILSAKSPKWKEVSSLELINYRQNTRSFFKTKNPMLE